MTEAEAAELDELRAKAYGPNGALTDAQAQRLQELQDAARGFSPAGGLPEDTDPGREALEAGDAGAAESAETGHRQAASDVVATARRRLRSRLVPVAVVALAVLVGVGAGWALAAGTRASSIELTAQQQDWQDSIAATGDYDDGSLRALAVDAGTQIGGDVSPVAWAATREHGAERCLIVGDEAGSAATCATEYVARRDSMAVSYPRADDESGHVTITTALAIVTPDGEMAGRLTTHWLIREEVGRVSEDVVARDSAVIAKNFAADALEMIGAFEAYPVWLASVAGGQSCLIYIGEIGIPLETCAPTRGLADQPLRLSIISHDAGEPDGAGEQTTFELTFTDEMSSRQLLITRTPEDEIQPVG
ncbi:hypothetical protein [Microbacterium sp. NPDC056234]|uniref:hypothetical protein n=1 Tax=Microbacterium sp. NPDC056234 TaxID=3345757 RepID=UPI0035E3A7E8